MKFFGWGDFGVLISDIDIHGEFIHRYLESGENRVIGRTRRLTAKKKDGTIISIQVNFQNFP